MCLAASGPITWAVGFGWCRRKSQMSRSRPGRLCTPMAPLRKVAADSKVTCEPFAVAIDKDRWIPAALVDPREQ